VSGNGEGVVVGVGAHHFRGAWRSFSKGNNPVSKLRLSGLARHAYPLDKR